MMVHIHCSNRIVPICVNGKRLDLPSGLTHNTPASRYPGTADAVPDLVGCSVGDKGSNVDVACFL